MTEHLILSLAVVIILGISAQWLAWMLRVPSILLLLLFGLVAGPVAGFIDPDAILGDVLFPAVSLSVAVILFEGGLSLRIIELKQVGRTVRNLVTLGALITWFFGTLAARFLLGLPLELAVLFGAILIVTGPTVIGPLLRHLRPTGPVGPILKWESILIDPIGATVSVLVFEAIRSGVFEEITSLALTGVMKTLLLGGLVGGAGAGIIIVLLMKYWIPDYLQNPLSLTMVIAVYAVSNLFQAESGLLAVTVMGVVLANQKIVSVRHIVEFKENIRVLLISTLFILLAARLTQSDLAYLNFSTFAFLVFLLVVVRPAAVWLSTLGSELGWRERFFIGAVAPRGIVAAAVSSIFAIRLVEGGNAAAEALIPLTFMMIIGTVVVYGLSAPAIAFRLKLARPKPQGALIIGAHHWAQEIAKVLQSEGHRVILVDNSWRDISKARMAGLPAFFANVLSEYALEQIDMGGLGRLLALTPNDEVNSLAVLHFSHLFGRKEVYQLASDEEPREKRDEVSSHLRGRHLFGKEMNYSFLSQQFNKGMAIKKTPLTKEFDYDAFRALYGEEAVILFIKNPAGEIIPFTADRPLSPKPGQTLISLVDPNKEVPVQEKPAVAPASEG